MTAVPYLLAGVAVFAGARMARTAEREVFRAVPSTSDPAVVTAMRALSLAVGGVRVLDSDGPSPAAGETPLAPLSAAPSPLRWYGAQKWALVRVKGSWGKVGGGGRWEVPRATLDELAAWLTQWTAAHLGWMATVHATLEDDDRERWMPRINAVREAGAALAPLLVRLENVRSWGGGQLQSVTWADETQEAIARYAGLLTPGSVDSVPLPLPIVGNYAADAASAVLGVLERAGGAAAGVAGAAALSLVGRVLTSPAGAALLLFAAWKVLR